MSSISYPGRGPGARRDRRASLACESLESRRLLSASTLSTASSATAQSFLQVSPMAGTASSGLSPQQVDSAYGISSISFSGVTGNGSGQTIAIVDAYNDSNIASDLAAFDKSYGLSAPPSFTVDNLGTSTTNSGWAVETALDVEWAHAVAPEANIVLVEAPSASMSALMNAVTAASQLQGVSVVSMSWGTSEYYGEWNNEGVFTTPAGHTNETFVAASGDSGAWSGPMFPAVSPNVLAVGGTNLSVSSSGTYQGETGWSDSTGGFSGMDNGFQYGLSVPSYQVSAHRGRAGLRPAHHARRLVQCRHEQRSRCLRLRAVRRHIGLVRRRRHQRRRPRVGGTGRDHRPGTGGLGQGDAQHDPVADGSLCPAERRLSRHHFGFQRL